MDNKGYYEKFRVEIPEGWVKASMMQGTHTIDEDGKIAPYVVPFSGSLVDVADAIIKLRLTQIHRVGQPRFKEAEDAR